MEWSKMDATQTSKAEFSSKTTDALTTNSEEEDLHKPVFHDVHSGPSTVDDGNFPGYGYGPRQVDKLVESATNLAGITRGCPEFDKESKEVTKDAFPFYMDKRKPAEERPLEEQFVDMAIDDRDDVSSPDSARLVTDSIPGTPDNDESVQQGITPVKPRDPSEAVLLLYQFLCLCKNFKVNNPDLAEKIRLKRNKIAHPSLKEINKFSDSEFEDLLSILSATDFLSPSEAESLLKCWKENRNQAK